MKVKLKYAMKRGVALVCCLVVALVALAVPESADNVRVVGYKLGEYHFEATATVCNESPNEIEALYFDVRYEMPDGEFVCGNSTYVKLDKPLKPGGTVTCKVPSIYLTNPRKAMQPDGAELKVEISMVETTEKVVTGYVKVVKWELAQKDGEPYVTITNEAAGPIQDVALRVTYVLPGGDMRYEPVRLILDRPLEPGDTVRHSIDSETLTYAYRKTLPAGTSLIVSADAQVATVQPVEKKIEPVQKPSRWEYLWHRVCLYAQMWPYVLFLFGTYWLVSLVVVLIAFAIKRSDIKLLAMMAVYLTYMTFTWWNVWLSVLLFVALYCGVKMIYDPETDNFVGRIFYNKKKSEDDEE